MKDGSSAIDVYLQKEMHNIRQYQHLIRVFDKQFFVSYKYNTFTFNVYLFISIILIFQKSCVILSQNAIGKLSGRKCDIYRLDKGYMYFIQEVEKYVSTMIKKEY